MNVCCGRVNRGLAIHGDTLYMGTIDGKLVALDAKTGGVAFTKQIVDPTGGYSLTHAPLALKDKLILGSAGGEYGIRGFIVALGPEERGRDLAFQYHSGAGRAGARNVVGRLLEAWRRVDLADRILRPGPQPDLLGVSAIRARLERRRAPRRQPVHGLRGGSGRGHRRAEVVLPVHAARRVGLGLGPGPGSRRPGVGGAGSAS